MKTKFHVEILSVNENGKIDTYNRTVDDMISATRIVLTFKAKRGYEAKQWTIDKLDLLI